MFRGGGQWRNLHSFPSWFVGIAFAAIVIGALVPAAIMSIAAANLYTRNVHREFINRNPSDRQEAQMANIVSLVVKFGALVFILFIPTQYAIYLQLLGGIWIIQTLPAVIGGAYTRWFNDWALFVGWAVGIVLGTWMAAAANLTPTYALQIAGFAVPGYGAVHGDPEPRAGGRADPGLQCDGWPAAGLRRDRRGGLPAVMGRPRHVITRTGAVAMSKQKDLLLEIAAAINTGSAYHIGDWFTEDFRLHEPARAALPVGHAGAAQMLERSRALAPPINLEALDMVEEDDRVAVRWQVTAIYDGKRFEESIMAIYRFEEGRIAEDWGIPIRALWP